MTRTTALLSAATILLATAAVAQVPPPPPGGPRPGPEAGAPPPPPPGGPRRGAEGPPPPKAAHFRFERGDTRIDVKCADDEPMKGCADITMQLVDKLSSMKSGEAR